MNGLTIYFYETTFLKAFSCLKHCELRNVTGRSVQVHINNLIDFKVATLSGLLRVGHWTV